jgi:hypothetical protein
MTGSVSDTGLIKNSGGPAPNNNKDFQMWQYYHHPVLLEDAEMVHQKLVYTHSNPVESKS